MDVGDSNEASTSDSVTFVVNDPIDFRFLANLLKSFEIELPTFHHVIRVDVDDDKSHSDLWFPHAPGTSIGATCSADTGADFLKTLPTDLLTEILKRLGDSDIRTLRRVSSSWRHAFRNLVHKFPGCAQLPARKALWISTLHGENAVAFLSNETSSRSKLYSRVFRFAERDVFPAEVRMVASEAGLICMKGDIRIRTYTSNQPTVYVDDDLGSRSAGASRIASSCEYRLVVCNPVLMDFNVLPTFQDLIEDLLAEPEAMFTKFGALSLKEKSEAKHLTKFGLVVDAYNLSYKVVVVSPSVRVQVFDSSCGVWRLGTAPPEGVLFSEEKMAVTYKACIYFVATEAEVPSGQSCRQMKWFIMRYDTKGNTWQRMLAVKGVHRTDSWTICQHTSLPDLVAMSDGVILVADNDEFTNKHIFRYNESSCEWDLIFHVPIFFNYISSFGPLKCIGTQMNLYFLLPNSFPFIEVDLGSKQWAWCLPRELHNEQNLKKFSETVSVTGTLAFEPSLHPASEPRDSLYQLW
ncbi:hypothetical protein R1flu_026252 [Riccia fluitans]|uniref:F-box domain-containing protein n=1 Tax=Riccia fluitans TaxID=41844 RepID=A0ABD1XG11_9MARC